MPQDSLSQNIYPKKEIPKLKKSPKRLEVLKKEIENAISYTSTLKEPSKIQISARSNLSEQPNPFLKRKKLYWHTLFGSGMTLAVFLSAFYGRSTKKVTKEKKSKKT